MKFCKNCKKQIPYKATVDGIVRRLNKRKYCLECSPWGQQKGYELRKRGNGFSKENLEKLVKESDSISEVLRKMGRVAAGSNFVSIKRCISEFNLDTKHFTGKSHLKGKTHNWSSKIPLEEILVENSQYVSSNCLKGRLIKEGLFQKKCHSCNLIKWLGVDIPLELEHINGNHSDNRIENLTILCPNCHALTPTYCGKNIKIRRKNKSDQCKNCNKNIFKGRKFCSWTCSNQYNKNGTKTRKVAVRPSKDELVALVNKFGYCATGRQFGVSDNAIRKWLKSTSA